MPCGLIVNELITNALKHAFPGERCGTVTVAASSSDGHVLISVHDDGTGLPEDFDLSKGTGLGMVIVDTLARQLVAALAIDRVGGTTFALRIPLEPPAPA